MTYPPSSPGYPPAPQSGSQYGATQPQFAKPAESGESSLPEFLLMAVAALGLIVYLLTFADLVKATDGFVVSSGSSGVDTTAALLAGLLAGVSLLPKQRRLTAVVAAISTLAALLVISAVIGGMDFVTWAYWAILALTVIQAGCAIAALLYDAGVLTPPAPKPAYDQQPGYGQYGGPSQYYGQQNQPQHGGQHYQQAPAQRPGYPSQYGSYPGGSNTGGFPSQQGGQGQQAQQGQQSGPPTPPTGFPTYGQPQQQSNASAPTTQVPAQPQGQQSPSQQSGPAPS